MTYFNPKTSRDKGFAALARRVQLARSAVQHLVKGYLERRVTVRQLLDAHNRQIALEDKLAILKYEVAR